MGIDSFMQGCKAVRQARDERAFAALFTPDGQYHDTPFALQRGALQQAGFGGGLCRGCRVGWHSLPQDAA